MEIRNLITFIQVAELGSFTRTAKSLGYSQSTVSFQIKQLEEELDCLLFERINHTITLTEKGHELLSYAHRICALTDEFKEGLSKSQDCEGHIHIVTPDSLCEDMIHTNYIDFHNHYPAISLKFTTADTTDMFRMLDHNEADIIMTLDNHIYNRDYIIAKEEPVKMHFVASASSRYAQAEALSIHEIVSAPFILTERGQGYRRVLDHELEKQSIDLVPVLEVGRTDIITSILAQSEMISFLPDFVSDKMVASGLLTYLNVTDLHFDIWKQLIYHKNKWLSQSLKTFIDYVKVAEFTH